MRGGGAFCLENPYARREMAEGFGTLTAIDAASAEPARNDYARQGGGMS